MTTATAAAVAVVTFAAIPSPPKTWTGGRHGCATDYVTETPGQVKPWALGLGKMDPRDRCSRQVELLADDSDSIGLFGLTLLHQRRLGYRDYSFSFECWGAPEPIEDQVRGERRCWRLDCEGKDYDRCSFTWCESHLNYPETMRGGHEGVLRTYCESSNPTPAESIYFATQVDLRDLE